MLLSIQMQWSMQDFFALASWGGLCTSTGDGFFWCLPLCTNYLVQSRYRNQIRLLAKFLIISYSFVRHAVINDTTYFDASPLFRYKHYLKPWLLIYKMTKSNCFSIEVIIRYKHYLKPWLLIYKMTKSNCFSIEVIISSIIKIEKEKLFSDNSRI